MSCKKCQEVKTPCFQQSCGCTYKVDTDCITYSGEYLTCSSIPSTTNLSKVLEGLDNYICDVKDLIGSLQISNVGSGAESFKGINVTGVREFRTLVSTEPNLTITEGTNTIDFDIAESSVSNRGLIEIATQTEVNTGSDNLRAVTPLTLNNKTATETRRGVIEIATQAEADAGVDNTRAITPLRMATYVYDQINDIPSVPNATTSQRGVIELSTNAETQAGTDTERAVTPSTLNSRTSTEGRTGIIEIATQAEVNTGTDDTRAVTPLKVRAAINNMSTTLYNYIEGYVSNPDNLPNATTTSRGIAELATSAEVIAGTDNQRIVTPSGLSTLTATTTRRGLAEIATQFEVDQGTDATKYVTPATLSSAMSGISTGLSYEIVTVDNWVSDEEYNQPLPASVGQVLWIIPQAVFKISNYGYPIGSIIQLANGSGDQDGSSDRRIGVTSGVNSTSTTLYYSTGRVETIRQDTSNSTPLDDTDVSLRFVIVHTEPQDPKILSISPTSEQVGWNEGQFTFNITSNTSWSIIDNMPWLSVNPSSGTGNATITATYDQNDGSSNRTGVITAQGVGTSDATLSLTQDFNTLYLNLSTNTRSVGYAAGSFTFEIDSNTSWSISTNQPIWISISPTTGSGDQTITITYGENISSFARTSMLSISGTGVEEKTIAITQAAPPLTIYPVSARGPYSSLNNACLNAGLTTYYASGGTHFGNSDILYTNAQGTNRAIDGYYTDDVVVRRVTGGEGVLQMNFETCSGGELE